MMKMNKSQIVVMLCVLAIFLITSCAHPIRGGTAHDNAMDVHDVVIAHLRKSDELLSFCKLVHKDSVSIANIHIVDSLPVPSANAFHKDIIRLKYGVDAGSVSGAEYREYRRQESLLDWERVKRFFSSGRTVASLDRLGDHGFDLLVSDFYTDIVPGHSLVFAEIYPVYPNTKDWDMNPRNMYMCFLFVFTSNSIDTVFSEMRIQ